MTPKIALSIKTLTIWDDQLTSDLFEQFDAIDPLTGSGKLCAVEWIGRIFVEGETHAFGYYGSRVVRCFVDDPDDLTNGIDRLVVLQKEADRLRREVARQAVVKRKYDEWLSRKNKTIALCPIPDTKEDGGSRMSWLSARYEAPPEGPNPSTESFQLDLDRTEGLIRHEQAKSARIMSAAKSYRRLRNLPQFFIAKPA